MDVTGPPKARPLSELLPELGGILSKEAIKAMTAQKQPRPVKPVTLTAEKVLKPMTIAEMRADIQALKIQSPRILPQGATSNKKRWNSSVKVQNKVVSHTANGQMKHNTVRKVLNFQQPKPKIARATNAHMMLNSDKPNFLKPELKPKKSLHLQAGNVCRISGICQISDTPLSNKPITIRMSVANKENISNPPLRKIIGATPKSSLRKQILASRLLDTPISNESWKSSCDDSFLQNEKNTEMKDDTLKNILEVSPPASTPFKEYRNVKEFFNNSSDVMDDSSTAAEDNTIMCFDKTSVIKENSKREESVIVSLCDMLNKATVSNVNAEKTNKELDDLLEIENQTVNHLKMIENGITTLLKLKESQLESLKHVRKLINVKQEEHLCSSYDNEATIKTQNIPKIILPRPDTPRKSPMAEMVTCSLRKSCLKSPSYKIPKKNVSNIRKKVLFRSVPNISHMQMEPPKPMGDRALSMYMEMKESLKFLSTPVVKRREMTLPDTPAITSNNLQLQLEKLYGES